MASLFPVHEFEANQNRVELLAIPDLIVVPDARLFSIDLASSLIDLCRLTASMSVREQNNDVFVAFSGSGDHAEIFNVRGTTRVAPIPFGNGRVYGPLLDAYRGIVKSELASLPNGKRIWLTGHGIGGAFALLAAVELADRNCVAAVYTFGAPRVGNRAFVSTIIPPVFRVVNNLDVMVTLPAAWTWRHAGSQKLINADGTLNSHPTPLNRLPSLVRQTGWLGQMLGEGLASGFPRALNSLLRQVVTDHFASAYSARLHALCHLC